MSMAVGGKAGGPMADINVTPMADIMIVLLIIFMVMTPLLDEGGVRLPPASNAFDQAREANAIVVSIRSDTTVSLGDERLDNLGELALKLSERLEVVPEGSRTIYVRGDEGLAYSTVWKVLEVCREAGADEVALLARRTVGG
jgi:biopolymer transport protein TolR